MNPRVDGPQIDLSATAEERLEGLGALYRLGQSLLSAQGPTISRACFERRSLRLERRLSAQDLGLRDLHLPDGVCDVWVACGGAGGRHEVGSEFDLLLPEDGSGPVISRCILVGVVIAPDNRVDALPVGSPAACALRFFGRVPAPVLALPGAREAAAGSSIWLATAANWHKLTPGSDVARIGSAGDGG